MAVALSALVVANLVLDYGLWCCVPSRGFLGYLAPMAIGTLLGQTLLLALWMSCGEARWMWRLAFPVLLAALLGAAAILGVGFDPAGIIFTPVLLEILLLALVALLLPLRRLRGWRLTNSAETAAGPRSRFQISDLLVWMLVIGVPLALVRLLSIPAWAGPAPPAFRALVMFLLLLPPLLWMVLLASFAPKGRSRTTLSVVGVVLCACVATAIGTRLWYPLLMELPGPAGWVVLLQSIALSGSFYFLVPLVLSLNCLALRALGWRLARPAWQASLGAAAEPALPGEIAAVN
jgi:hypothetical protein